MLSSETIRPAKFFAINDNSGMKRDNHILWTHFENYCFQHEEIERIRKEIEDGKLLYNNIITFALNIPSKTRPWTKRRRGRFYAARKRVLTRE